MKITKDMFSLCMKRLFAVSAIIVLASMVACESENAPESSSAQPPGKAPQRESAKPSNEAAPQTAPPKTETVSNPAGLNKIVGKWVRTDSPYVIEIRSVKKDGTLDAGYYNPRSINVGRAQAKTRNNQIEVFVELQDVNYPGSTYTLTYDKKTDMLQGVYFMAGGQQKQSFPIEFTRQQ